MAGRFLLQRLATVNVTRTPPGHVSSYVLRQTNTGTNRFSTAFNQTNGTESMKDDKSTTSYVADKAKERVKNATDAAMNAGDNVKDTIEGAWKTAKETGQNITNAVVGDDNDRIQEDKVALELKDVTQPVDTTEYRGVEELQQLTGGENKSP